MNDKQLPTGYLHPDYAASLVEFGTPRQLLHTAGWILTRQIPGFPTCWDGMGCYPLFSCQDWSTLHLDLKELEESLVTIALVTDPFGNYNEKYLTHCFDRVSRFKEHFVVDLTKPRDAIVSKHHRYYARKALKTVQVECCSQPSDYVDEWTALYQNIVERYNLSGLKAFSRLAFSKQLEVPGVVLHRATVGGELIAAHIWYIQKDVAYSHLAASSPLGYELMASYALYWFAIDYFSNFVKLLDLGAGAGGEQDSNSGLSRFKKGWATGTKPVYFCGRIFNHTHYKTLIDANNAHETAYFPGYRSGEFR